METGNYHLGTVSFIYSCHSSDSILTHQYRGSELANRAQVSAAISSTIALILSIIAIIVTARVSSSDYQAQQDVNAATSQLLASLRSIIAKGVVLSQKPNIAETPLDFKQEREVLNNFLSSTTAFAYWSWEGEKSQKAANKSEEWRLFFLIDILDSKDAEFRKMISRAVGIEGLLTSLSKRDMQQISNYRKGPESPALLSQG